MNSSSHFTPKMVLIDIDGTLVDSVPDLAYCIDTMLMQLHLPPAGTESVREWVGNGIERLVERALAHDLHGKPDPARLQQALPIFVDLYRDNIAKRSCLYPDVITGLDYLAQCPHIKVGCITNKASQFTQSLLTELGLIERFAIIISGDSLAQKKPHPLPLLHAARALGIPPNPNDALMIGDSQSDVQAARAAGFAIICVSYGYNHGEDIRVYQPDAIIDSMTELTTLIR